MTKPATPQIISANALLGGEVIYLTDSGGWSGWRGDAAVATDSRRSDELLATAQSQPAAAVGPYLVDVRLSPGGVPEPSHMREAMRAHGPTVGRLNQTPPAPAQERDTLQTNDEPEWLDCAE